MRNISSKMLCNKICGFFMAFGVILSPFMTNNWTSAQIKQAFFDFFESKGHKIVPSAPIVVKGDPTLMFTNAGMNQFKDYFLNNAVATDTRIADTQKCLRVSGKHNDLEEVGHDHYHHTMFEMLGNWSFGDYFKKEAIAWAWELLTDVYKLDKNRLYVTVFEGDDAEGLAMDQEAKDFWKEWIAEDRILLGNKKDNFWEMGDTGPCGPCTEIHYDGRSDEERAKVSGASLVNADHEDVIEIWNNVFMEFNRKANGSLEKLPAQHVDTGMGFERLVRIIQGKNSNYATDVFQYIITNTANVAGLKYGHDSKQDIALRVIADHIRAVSMCIADGQLPASNGAGYVVRRILRRAVRYGYSYLNLSEPFLYTLIPGLASYFAKDFPELLAQQDFVATVIEQEEKSFFRTLSKGMGLLLDQFDKNEDKVLSGKVAFELFDTYGFPVDLTDLICREQGRSLNMAEFATEMAEQKSRSKQDAQKETGDWVQVNNEEESFVGYDALSANTHITRYRTLKVKGKDIYQLVLAHSPFYAESGGQVGDVGHLLSGSERINIIDCQKENKLHVLLADKLPSEPELAVFAQVNEGKRQLISRNHSATHLMHSALRQVLGLHVAQKGSLVNEKLLRFDFSHFSKVEKEQLDQVESIVNTKIKECIALNELRDIPIAEAEKMGATALFGEKYGDTVRVIVFDKDFSMELCGGTHVKNTQEIGLFKFISEGSVASGVRRVEAVCSAAAIELLSKAYSENESIAGLINNPKDRVQAIEKLLEENQAMRGQMAKMESQIVNTIKADLKDKIETKANYSLLVAQVNLPSAEAAKNLCFQLKQETSNLVCVLAFNAADKPGIAILIPEDLVKSHDWNAGKLVRDWGKYIQGGGGGQGFFATAGGKDLSGLPKVIAEAKVFFA